MTRIVTPIKGGPAYVAGLRADDLISHVTRQEAADVPVLTRGLTPEQVGELLVGTPGTRVRLIVRREGVRRPLVFDLERREVAQETVLGWRRRADNEWDYWLEPASKIAYVRITRFARSTARDLERVMDNLMGQGLQALVLDLRFNPGGLLNSAIKVSDLFVGKGLIVTARPGAGRETRFSCRRPSSLLGFPLACLVNGVTASSGEIVAACLQDHRRARIIGERTRGKGSVQNIQELEHHELKLTTAVFYRPSGGKLDRMRIPGRSADEWGVVPDPGCAVLLPEQERARLLAGLGRAEAIYLSGRRPRETHADRQRDLALAYLRGALATGLRRIVSPTTPR